MNCKHFDTSSWPCLKNVQCCKTLMVHLLPMQTDNVPYDL